MPGATSSCLLPVAMPVLLVASSLATSSIARSYCSFLLLVAISLLLATSSYAKD